MPSKHRSEGEVIGYLAFMGVLLAFGIDASLPAFDELRPAFGLEADSNRITLIVTLYLVGMAVGQLLYGPLSDQFGRVRALQVGVGVYCLGAVGAIVAPSFELLLFSRLVWGLGAAAPGVLRAAVARDLYEGSEMARVVSIMMGVFLMGPVVAPIVGEGILAVGSWEWVFAAALVLAAIQLLWTRRFGETLPPELRRPFDLRSTLRGFRSVTTNATTLAYTAALTFGFGSFIIFLGSSQPIIDNIYGRGDQFVVWFAVASILQAISFFSVNHFIERWGSHRVAVTVAATSVLLNVVLLTLAIASDGVPTFAAWIALVAVSNALITLLTPTCYSLALEPMGAIAGTASAVMGFASTLGGSLLAGVVNATIEDAVTPMAVGYVVYGSLAVAALRRAGRSSARATP